MIRCRPLFQGWRADRSSWTHTGKGKAACTVTLISSDCPTEVMRWINERFRWKRELVLLTQRGCCPLWVSRHTSQGDMSKKNLLLRIIKATTRAELTPLTVSGCYREDACGVPVISSGFCDSFIVLYWDKCTSHSNAVQRGCILKWPEREQNAFV